MTDHTHDWKGYGLGAKACFECKTISFHGDLTAAWSESLQMWMRPSVVTINGHRARWNGSGWERDDSVRGVAKEPAMEETRREAECPRCHRNNDLGQNKCWHCELPDPAPIQTTDDPDWSSSMMKQDSQPPIVCPCGSYVAASYWAQHSQSCAHVAMRGATLPPIPFPPPSAAPSLTLTDRDEIMEFGTQMLQLAGTDMIYAKHDDTKLGPAIAKAERALEILRALK